MRRSSALHSCAEAGMRTTATTGQGLWLGLAVPAADAECARLESEGMQIIQPPTDQPWGERTLLLRDPDGMLVYLAHPIPAADSFTSQKLAAAV
jgi:uncharacterized glyoxalase superfamily protein PhnB